MAMQVYFILSACYADMRNYLYDCLMPVHDFHNDKQHYLKAIKTFSGEFDKDTSPPPCENYCKHFKICGGKLSAFEL